VIPVGLRDHPKSSHWCTHLLTITHALQRVDNVSGDNHGAFIAEKRTQRIAIMPEVVSVTRIF